MNQSIEIAILAGGQSRRMGTDKSELKLGGKTLLEFLKDNLAPLNFPIRVIQKDSVPSCGPLGGIITALQPSTAEATLFLSVDMPFVTLTFLEEFLTQFSETQNAQFTSIDGRSGFPCILPQKALANAEQLHQKKIYALQKLVKELDAGFVKVSDELADCFLNINTPEDWQKAVTYFKSKA